MVTLLPLRDQALDDECVPVSGLPSTQRESLIPFVSTTTYEVWFRLAGQDWRLWSRPYTEEHHAREEKQKVDSHGVRAGLTPRETRIARRVTTVEWVDE